MALSEALLPEFDQEMANTRVTLERVPEDKFTWKPHQKSGTMGCLAGHLSNIPSWVVTSISQDSLDLAPAGGPVQPLPPPKSLKELLATFDRNVAEARAAIAAASDSHLMKPWTLLKTGQTVLTMPRMAVLRAFVMNHSIHHRAQLGVYLRLNNLPVPAIYGPSADEGSM
ncbi:MAG TPA: DinB family protein [Candidatus Acidoferrales bacterium]|jgi:uncharacterized damage-inducible protein DinB|nr:DinB family protein [Candidatus Acidoferrales bacterium]